MEIGPESKLTEENIRRWLSGDWTGCLARLSDGQLYQVTAQLSADSFSVKPVTVGDKDMVSLAVLESNLVQRLFETVPTSPDASGELLTIIGEWCIWHANGKPKRYG